MTKITSRRAALRTLVDRGVTRNTRPVRNELAHEELRGLAAGAGVAEESVRYAADVFGNGQAGSDVIPNDVDLDGRVLVLTGANMGGKSTVMRLAASLTVLAQVFLLSF